MGKEGGKKNKKGDWKTVGIPLVFAVLFFIVHGGHNSLITPGVQTIITLTIFAIVFYAFRFLLLGKYGPFSFAAPLGVFLLQFLSLQSQSPEGWDFLLYFIYFLVDIYFFYCILLITKGIKDYKKGGKKHFWIGVIILGLYFLAWLSPLFLYSSPDKIEEIEKKAIETNNPKECDKIRAYIPNAKFSCKIHTVGDKLTEDFCEEISKQTNEWGEFCFGKLAEIKINPTYCSKSHDEWKCIYDVAIKANDIKICEQLESNSAIINCNEKILGGNFPKDFCNRFEQEDKEYCLKRALHKK